MLVDDCGTSFKNQARGPIVEGPLFQCDAIILALEPKKLHVLDVITQYLAGFVFLLYVDTIRCGHIKVRLASPGNIFPLETTAPVTIFHALDLWVRSALRDSVFHPSRLGEYEILMQKKQTQLVSLEVVLGNIGDMYILYIYI